MHTHMSAYPVDHEVDCICHFRVHGSFSEVPQNNLLQHESWHQPETGEERGNEALVMNVNIQRKIWHGIIKNHLFAVHVWLKMEVSLNELHSISECTLGDLCVHSANFWAKNPPRDAPNRWTWRFKGQKIVIRQRSSNIPTLKTVLFLYSPWPSLYQDCSCLLCFGLQPTNNSSSHSTFHDSPWLLKIVFICLVWKVILCVYFLLVS